MNVFTVIKRDSPMPWTIKHHPTGLYAGSFHYKRHALAAAASLEATAVKHPELSRYSECYSSEAWVAMMEARKAHTDADRAQAVAAEAKRKRKKVQP